MLLDNKKHGKVGNELRKHLEEGSKLAVIDGTQTILGFVPLSEMFGYATDLRSSTQGRAMFTMEFDHFAPVPDPIMTTLMNKWGVELVPHRASKQSSPDAA